MRYLNIMLKPASSLCNLRCKYCFYADVASHRDIKSYGLIDENSTNLILNNIFSDLEPGDRVNIAFQGGEPTLSGLSYYKFFIDAVNKVKKDVTVTYALQTNATTLDDEWCLFLKDNRFLVGVSLDGPEQMHNMCRVNAEQKGTFKDVMVAVKKLQQYSVDFNLLMTLTNTLAKHPTQVWNFITANDFRYVQFTPCLAPFDDTGKDPYALTPQKFADFYIQIFNYWKKELDAHNYYSIKLFDDIVNLLAFRQVNACGLIGNCSSQIVVEADGSVFPCDFYTLDQWCLGNLTQENIAHIFSSPRINEFITRPRKRELCSNCKYNRICNGACHRMQPNICYKEGASVCGYRKFLDATINQFLQIAQRERNFTPPSAR